MGLEKALCGEDSSMDRDRILDYRGMIRGRTDRSALANGGPVMPDDLNPSDLVSSLRRGKKDGRDRLHRLCSRPIERLVDRITAPQRAKVERRAVVDLALGWVEM